MLISRGRFAGLGVLALILLEVFIFGLGHATTTTVVLSTDGELGTASIATNGGQKLIQDSTGRLFALYVDNSGRIGISFANSFPSLGAWSTPTKSPTPSVAYARPAAVLVSPTSLRIIVEGGTGSGHIDDVPVTISRDAQSNILSVSFGSPTILDGSGFSEIPTATLAHNSDILAAWNWLNSGDSSRVKALRWIAGTGWRSFSGSTTIPDDVIVDSSNRVAIFPSIIERGDNDNVYVMGNRDQSSTTRTFVYDKATFNGSNWSWGAQNLSYESNAARGLEDSPSLTWDATRSQVVAVYDIGGTNACGVFTLDASDNKVHADTPNLLVTDNDYETLTVDSTGAYALFVLDATADGSSGKVGYTTRTGSTWNTTLTYIDSGTNNIGISLRRIGSTNSMDLLYSKGSSAPTSIIFVRISASTAPLAADFTFTPASPSLGQSVTFTATASGGTPPYTFAWSFGDGATGSGGTVSHSYSQTGSFSVKFTATDNSGSSVIAQHTVTVGTLTFVTTGDYGFSSRATTNWNSMSTSGASFALALGDLLYQVPPPTEQDWCNSFKSNISNVELIVGNHETFESNTTNGGGSINKFIAACPFTLGTRTGSYGFQYSFDYPSTSPMVRFIMVMPAVWNGTTSSSSITYDNGTATQAWVGSQIDSARSQGIPWVIVGMHKVCITAGVQGCEISQDFMRFLISKKVDIVLQGHDHNYQRSKQLKCATAGVYVSACVANDGSTGSYSKGAGTVFLIDGTGGDSLSNVNPSDSEFPYFARLNDTTFGYTKYTVSGSSVQATFVPTSGTFTDSWNITTATPNFTISANPTNLSFQAGSSGTSTLTLSSLVGFSGTVTLSASVAPAGPTASLSPLSVSLSSGGTGTSTLTVSTTSSTAAGTYTVTVTGTSGSLSHSVTVKVTVTPDKDFAISANPTTVSFQSGASGTSLVTLTSLNGYTGTVALSAVVSPVLPGGPSASFSPGSITLTSGASGSSTLTVTATAGGSYTVTVTGTDGTLSHSVSVTVNVRDFSLSSTPSTLNVYEGFSGSSTLTLTSLGGFSGTITLSSTVTPPNLTQSLSPTSVSLAAGGSGTSTLTVSASPSTAPGSYSVLITGTGSGLTHSVTLTVKVVDFSISAVPTSLTIKEGSSGTSSISLASLGGFAGTVSFSTSVSPSGLTATVSPGSVTLASGGTGSATVTLSSTTAGNYILTVTGTVGPLSHAVSIQVKVVDFAISTSASIAFPAGSSATSPIILSSLNGFNGTITLTSSVSPSSGLTVVCTPTSLAISSNATSATSTCTFASSTPGTYTVTISGTDGTILHSVSITVNVQDFTLSSSPSTLTINLGSSGTSTVTLASLGGFSGTISLSTTVSPSNLTQSLSPTSVGLTPGGSGTSTLTVTTTSTTAPGSYSVLVTGTGGGLSHSITITINVVDFSISASQTSIALTQGSSASVTLTLSSVGGFSSTVSLSRTSSPSGLKTSLTPTSLTLPSGGTGTSILKITAARRTNVGTYTVIVTGTNGGLSHSVSVTVAVSAPAVAFSVKDGATAGGSGGLLGLLQALTGVVGESWASIVLLGMLGGGLVRPAGRKLSIGWRLSY